MQYITKQDLVDLNITVKEDEVDTLLTHLNEKLEDRVGTEITEALSDEQLDEYVKLQESATDEEAGKWLNEVIPELAEIVQDEIDILLGELAENADGISEAG